MEWLTLLTLATELKSSKYRKTLINNAGHREKRK
jgi:hypothetical protein